MRDGIDTELAKKFQEYDRRPDGAALSEIRGILNRRRYIRNLVNEVEKELTGAAV
jgi:hypothetical protein